MLIKTVRRRLLPGTSGVRDLIGRIMSAVKNSASRGDELRELAVDLGLLLTYTGPGSGVLRPLTEEVQDAQDSFEIKVGHLRRAFVDGDAQQAEWCAVLLGELIWKLPDESWVVEVRTFAEREDLIGRWTPEMARELLNGLDFGPTDQVGGILTGTRRPGCWTMNRWLQNRP